MSEPGDRRIYTELSFPADRSVTVEKNSLFYSSCLRLSQSRPSTTKEETTGEDPLYCCNREDLILPVFSPERSEDTVESQEIGELSVFMVLAFVSDRFHDI